MGWFPTNCSVKSRKQMQKRFHILVRYTSIPRNTDAELAGTAVKYMDSDSEIEATKLNV